MLSRKYIYLINCLGSDIYKIGTTKNIQQRLASLQTGNAKKLILVDSAYAFRANRLEANLHCRFARNRLQGEWFRLDGGDVLFIREQFALH